MQQFTYHTIAVSDRVRYEIAVRPNDPDPIGQSIAKGDFSLQTYLPLFALMRPGCRVLDLGTHIGTFSLAAAAHGCEVVSVEASPWNAALLQASIDRNSFGKRIRVANVAVSDFSGTLEFIQAGPFGLVANPTLSDRTTLVPAVTGDDLLAQMGWDCVDLIKLDVEGSEVAAVRGMPRLLSRADAPAILFESNGHTLRFFNETPRSLLGAIEQFGYCSYIPGERTLTPFSSAEFQPEGLVDYLAIKQIPTALQDWRVLPPMSQEETIQKILQTCTHDNVYYRIFMASALSEAGVTLTSDLRVAQALSAMRVDSDARVRSEAARTWTLLKQKYGSVIAIAPLDLEALLEHQADIMSRDYQVRSHIPLVGGLIAWVRRNLTSHLWEPYLDPALERQVAFNRHLVHLLQERLSQIALQLEDNEVERNNLVQRMNETRMVVDRLLEEMGSSGTVAAETQQQLQALRRILNPQSTS
jgi:FkbM family methyltransferase